jgi:hypothetical protein
LEILKVFESKAGKASSRGLKRSWKPVEELSEAAKNDLRMTAIDELRDQIPGIDKWPSSKIAATYPDKVTATMKQLNTSEAGQFRQDLERLFGSNILVDGQSVKVTVSPKSAEFVSVLPEGVSTRGIASMAEKQGIKYQAKTIKISQTDLQKLAEDLAKALPDGV